MSTDNVYQSFRNQVPPGYYGANNPGLGISNPQTTGGSPWGSPINLAGNNNYSVTAQGYPSVSQYANSLDSTGVPPGFSLFSTPSSPTPYGDTDSTDGSDSDGKGSAISSMTSALNGGNSPEQPTSNDQPKSTDKPTSKNPPSPSPSPVPAPPPPAPPPAPKVVGTAEQNTQARIDARSLVKGPDKKNLKHLDPAFDPNKTYSKDELKKMSSDIKKSKGSWKDDPFLKAIDKLTADNSGEAVVFNSVGGDKGWDMNKVKDFGNSPVPDNAIIEAPPKEGSKGGPKAGDSDGFIDTDTKQQSEGDCVFLSTTRGLAQTDEGRTDIKKAITSNEDGSYDVKFAGADKSYHVSKDDANKQGQWANGDKDMQVLGSAADQYFKDNGQSNGVQGQGYTNVSKLLTGNDTNHVALNGTNSSKDDIKKALLDAAPDIGKTKSVGLSGGVADGGDWKAKDTSHEFNIESIDQKTGTVTYTNPWDTSKKRTMSVDDMASQIADAKNGSTVDIKGS